MCGRFSLAEPDGVIERFNVGQVDAELKPRYNIAPSQPVAVLVKAHEANHLRMFRWGLISHWAQNASIGHRMINARVETLAEKPSFCRLLEQKRCLVLADGFYEWKKAGRSKKPHRVTLQNGGLFAFAGLWDSWISPTGQTVNSCTIITTAANRIMEPIHNRMPVILSQENESAWLNENVKPTDIKGLLKPFPAELMVAYEVGLMVNSPQNVGPECMTPVSKLF